MSLYAKAVSLDTAPSLRGLDFCAAKRLGEWRSYEGTLPPSLLISKDTSLKEGGEYCVLRMKIQELTAFGIIAVILRLAHGP